MSYRLIRPLLFRLDAERAHRLTIAALKLLPVGGTAVPDILLASRVAGVTFPNPVGLAAGFDKDGEVAHKMHALGFGFAELGTLTPLPQAGNPRPRLFRLVEESRRRINFRLPRLNWLKASAWLTRPSCLYPLNQASPLPPRN